MTARRLFSPRQLADALDVSESSVKRWCDQGLIEVERTAGGHRRVSLPAALRFLRESGTPLVRPQVLGLLGFEAAAGEPGQVRARLFAALAAGDEDAVRGALFGRYAAGRSVAELCDGEITPAFVEIGSRWQHGRLEVYEERRAVEICLRVLFDLRGALARPAAGAPRALGGTLEGDWSTLPTTMAELALSEAGWDARSLGAGQPAETLAAAVAAEAPRLFWISVSYADDADRLRRQLEVVHAACAGGRTALVVGGRALEPALRRGLAVSAFCDDMRQLQSLAAVLAPAGEGRRAAEEEESS
ncbi:MAG TPA: cobalamin-dependent protein [Thermoanaerobaculia bacterium]